MQSLNAAIIVFILLKVSANTQTINSYLPKPDECGKLNEKYFYNEQENVAFDEYPWIVQIFFKNVVSGNSFFKCGGILISKRHLLTNSACFADIERNDPTVVVLGKIKYENIATGKNCNEIGECGPEPQLHEIDDIALHSNNLVDESQASSIAIVRLTKDVEFNDYVQPICLPPDTNLNSDFATQYLPYVGFDLRTKFKRKIVAHIRSIKDCKELYKNFKRVNISENDICASCNNSVALTTGSALMGVSIAANAEPRFYLVGMMASGGSKCSTTTPDILMSISSHLNWIIYNMI